jgi:hypothetical protein
MLSSVTLTGYTRVKCAGELRSAVMHNTGHFTPQHRPYQPVGESVYIKSMDSSKDDMPQIMQQKPKTDRERLLSCEHVTVNDLEGHEVTLNSYDETFLQVRDHHAVS